jgi:hypothetical protein
MELLLNLSWVAMALAAFFAFAHCRRDFSGAGRMPYGTALLALACMLALLFPVISASDDLHPTQAVLEDATKRLQQVVAPLQHVQAGPFLSMLPALLALSLMSSLAASSFGPPVACRARVLHRERNSLDGRSPPSL